MIFSNMAPATETFLFNADTVQSLVSTGTGDLSVTSRDRSNLLTKAFSLYAQDTWKATSRLTLTYGLRWEVSPRPSGRGSTKLASWENTNDPSQFALAPLGTPLWQAKYANIAPRFGLAYALTGNHDLVVRAGVGTFYDLGVGQTATLATQFPNSASLFSGGVPVPISDATPYLPARSLAPPYPGSYGFDPNLKSPRSYQWNLALEKPAIGREISSRSSSPF